MRRILPRSDDAECRCGHARRAHRHLRAGTDCSICPGTCGQFRLRLSSLWERRDDGADERGGPT